MQIPKATTDICYVQHTFVFWCAGKHSSDTPRGPGADFRTTHSPVSLRFAPSPSVSTRLSHTHTHTHTHTVAQVSSGPTEPGLSPPSVCLSLHLREALQHLDSEIWILYLKAFSELSVSPASVHVLDHRLNTLNNRVTWCFMIQKGKKTCWRMMMKIIKTESSGGRCFIEASMRMMNVPQRQLVHFVYEHNLMIYFAVISQF